MEAGKQPLRLISSLRPHVHTHAYVPIHICAYIHLCAPACMHKFVPAHMHTQRNDYICVCEFMQGHVYMEVHTKL